MLAFDNNIAGGGNFGFEHCILSETAHQHAGAAIDEALGQTFVKRVGYPVLYLTRDALPMARNFRASRSDWRRRLHVRTCARRLARVAISPSTRSVTASWRAIQSPGILPRLTIKPKIVARQFGMRGRRGLAIIRDLASLPQSRDVGAAFAFLTISSSRCNASSASWSSCTGARAKQGLFGNTSSEADRDCSEEKSRSRIAPLQGA